MNKRRLMILVLVANLVVSLGASAPRTNAAPPSVRAPNPARSVASPSRRAKSPRAGHAPSADISASWWAAVGRDMRRSEYHVTWQDRTYLPDLPAAYQAPNRAHNLRTYFAPEGIRVIPRTPTQPSPWQGEGEGGGWEWGLALTGYGYVGSIQPVTAAQPAASGNRIEYQRAVSAEGSGPALTEWTINDERGLEQGFTLAAPPLSGISNPAPHIVLELGAAGNLSPVVADDGATIELTTPGGLRVLRYGDLRGTDATGRELPTRFSTRHSSLSILVDAADALYPITVASLLTRHAATSAWTAQGDQAGAQLGISVGAAGDVNGDGYGDVIVGAYMFDSGQTDEGIAAVYHGSATGPSTTPNWTTQGNQGGARFGFSVGTAGDVNNDGYDDVIVGAYYYDANTANEGRTYVYHGSAAGLSATADWTADGESGGDQFGVSVGTAGDVDGDGYDDVIVGAWGSGETNTGRAYVYHGGATGLTTGSADWAASPAQSGAQFGVSVGTAGDVNGDGYDDVIVGAWWYDNGETNEGRAYVYHGSATGLSTTEDWTAESDQDGANLGVSVGAAGDVNKDGYADVIVGAHRYDHGQTNEGAVAVYHGGPAGLTTGAADWTAESNQAGAQFGVSVGTAGDVNKDGYADVIVGAWLYDHGETDEGGVPSTMGRRQAWACSRAGRPRVTRPQPVLASRWVRPGT